MTNTPLISENDLVGCVSTEKTDPPTKVLSIFGTRPEAIKLAPVIKAMESHPNRIFSRVCITAQHRQMLDQVLDLFDIVPDYDLNIMQANQTPTQVAAAVLKSLEGILRIEKPDWVLVQGDTTTVMAASIAAFYAQIRVGHVEAGLRSRDKWQPFPEEINRRIAGVVADKHFAPTDRAKNNLLAEGIPPHQIVVTGNTVIDALHQIASMSVESPILQSFPKDRKLILVTAHRRENFGAPLENICYAIRDIAEKYVTEVQIVYPVHPNPNVQNTVTRILENLPNVSLLPPLNYLDMVHVMKMCYLVLTDSGGIQEEAPGLAKPVLVLRELTERPEAVEAGTARLVGADRDRIASAVSLLLENREEYLRMARSVNPFGDGHAAERILESLLGLDSSAQQRNHAN